MFDLETFQVSWYILFMLMLIGYGILDGFDLGVGIMHLFAKEDGERRIILNSIGPVWDGNEVWLVVAGGALFAGFPAVYATFCSAFYLPVMILLAGLIFRAVTIEFRSKRPMKWWRRVMDFFFSFSSFIIALGIGLVIGNLIQGLPLDQHENFAGHWLDFVSPYTLLTGAFAVSLFALHGTIYLLLKTEGELHEKVRDWVQPAMIAFIMLYAISTVVTLIYQEHMVQTIKERPHFFLLALINMLAVANIPREISLGRDLRAFLSSCLNVACLIALYGIGMFPNLLLSTNGNNLTAFNSSSSLMTMQVLHIIALIGVPLVLAYTVAIYTIFRGKVRLDKHSY